MNQQANRLVADGSPAAGSGVHRGSAILAAKCRRHGRDRSGADLV